MADRLATDGASIDGDRLPWLEAVEDEDDRRGPSAGKLIGALLVGLAAIALVIFVLFSLGNRGGGDGVPQEIAAASGDYKQPAPEAGGLEIEGQGDTAFAASEGAEPNGRIDLSAIPETPVAGARGVASAEQTTTRPPVGATQEPTQPAPVVQPVAVTPEPAAVAGGTAVQLGAFSSNAGAQAAWKSLSARIAALKPLTNAVVAASVGGKTVYRLRANVASSADADTLCGKLKVAGESCVIVS